MNAAKGNFDGPRQDYQIDANDQTATQPATTRTWWSPTATARRSMLTDVANVVDGVENNDAGGVDEPDAGGSS